VALNLAQARISRELPREHELHAGEPELERAFGTRVGDDHSDEDPDSASRPIAKPSRRRMFPYSRCLAAPTSATRTIVTSEVAMISS
jgi:hypothetical protein